MRCRKRCASAACVCARCRLQLYGCRGWRMKPLPNLWAFAMRCRKAKAVVASRASASPFAAFVMRTPSCLRSRGDSPFSLGFGGRILRLIVPVKGHLGRAAQGNGFPTSYPILWIISRFPRSTGIVRSARCALTAKCALRSISLLQLCTYRECIFVTDERRRKWASST